MTSTSLHAPLLSFVALTFLACGQGEFTVHDDGDGEASVEGSVAADTGIVVRAKGDTGSEVVQLELNGTRVATWTLTTAFADYRFVPGTSTRVSSLAVHFTNDGRDAANVDRNARIDSVRVAGTTYQTEDISVRSLGSWDAAAGCGEGNKRSEWLHCPGWARYAIAANTVVGPADTGGWQTGAGWTNVAFPSVGGVVSIRFDMRAARANINGVAGFTQGRASAYEQLAAIVRMNDTGTFDVRDGSAYAADAVVPYSAGTSYPIELDVDLARGRYDVRVVAGGRTIALRTNAAFRTGRVVTLMDNLAVYEPTDALSTRNLRVVVAGAPAPAPTPAPTPAPAGCGAASWSLPLGSNYGSWTQDAWRRLFPGLDRKYGDSDTNVRTLVVDGLPAQVHRVIPVPAGGRNGSSRVAAGWSLPPRQRYRLSQKIRLPDGFAAGIQVQSGKLGWGLGGGTAPSGGLPDPGGFSVRVTFRGDATQPDTRAVVKPNVYIYSADQAGTYGDEVPLRVNGKDVQFVRGKWMEVTLEVVMNSRAGAADGELRVWTDGALALQLRNKVWFGTGSPQVDRLSLSTFHGGADSRWAPSATNEIAFSSLCLGY